MRYDPTQAYIAQGVPDHAIGTLDELVAHKLPTKTFASCAEPTPDGSVRGCPLWYECTMSYKGLTVFEGGGPRAHCWEHIKSASNGGGIVRTCMPCYMGVAMQDIAVENEGALHVIADEGETYQKLTTVPDRTGPVEPAGFKRWKKELLNLVVPRFERLGEQQKLAEHELRASVIERQKESMKNERAAKVLGLPSGAEALDKRGRRGGKGEPEKGGSKPAA